MSVDSGVRELIVGDESCRVESKCDNILFVFADGLSLCESGILLKEVPMANNKDMFRLGSVESIRRGMTLHDAARLYRECLYQLFVTPGCEYICLSLQQFLPDLPRYRAIARFFLSDVYSDFDFESAKGLGSNHLQLPEGHARQIVFRVWQRQGPVERGRIWADGVMARIAITFIFEAIAKLHPDIPAPTFSYVDVDADHPNFPLAGSVRVIYDGRSFQGYTRFDAVVELLRFLFSHAGDQ
jgi:hypothetical protein